MKILGSLSIVGICCLLVWPEDNLCGAETFHASDDQIIQLKKLKIQKLLKEKKDMRRLLETIESDAYGILEILAEIKANIRKYEKNISLLKAQANALDATISEIKGNIVRYRTLVEEGRNTIDRQLQTLFYLKKTVDLTPFMALHSLKNIFRNRWILQTNATIRWEEVQQFERNMALLRSEKTDLERRLREKIELRKQKREQEKHLHFEKRQQEVYLRHIEKDRALKIKYLHEIQIEVERLNDVINTLEIEKERKRRAETFRGFQNRKNALAPPVKGKVVGRFGRVGGSRHNLYQRGILIETAGEEEVFSILEGTVVFAGSFRGYGKLIVLEHGRKSFSIYGNLSELFVSTGEIVDTQALLGTVGMDMESKRYVLYLETRKDKKPVNPLQWFQKNVWKQ